MMKTHPFAVLLAVMLGSAFISTRALGQVLSREDALEVLDRDIAKIRLEMNSSPTDATQRLMTMGASVGDDPRFIAICDEVIRKSTNTISRRAAVDSLHAAMELHGLSIRLHGRTQSVAHALEGALAVPDTQLRLEGIDAYVSLGGKYRKNAESLYARAFNDVGVETDVETKGALARAIRQLVGVKNGDLRKGIKQAVARADLIQFVKNRVGDPILAGSKSEDQQFLQKLEALQGQN